MDGDGSTRLSMGKPVGADRRARTEDELSSLMAQQERVRDKLAPTQIAYWTDRYYSRLTGMHGRAKEFRRVAQGARLMGVLVGAAVAALGGIHGTWGHIVVASLGVVIAGLNAAPIIYRTEGRVAINRRYEQRMFAEGWSLVLALDKPSVGHESGEVFEEFRARVEELLTSFEKEYADRVWVSG